MRSTVRSTLFGLALMLSASTAEARAAKHEPTDSGPSTSTAAPRRPGKTAVAKPAKGKKPAKAPRKSVESKKAPRKAGSTPGEPDLAKRASVAGQVPALPVTVVPELAEMREVDDALFPELFSETDVRPSLPQSPRRGVASGLPPAAGDPGPSTDSAPSDYRWMASLRKPDIPFRWDARLVRYLDYFKNDPKGRAFARALLKKSGRYEAKIRAAAKNRGLPEDIVWLALVESAMNARIASGAGAAGLWQFMPKAAQAYGLRMDKWVDERLDPERSTEAALKYLSDLHARFGRWELAFAAYNMGHGGLLTAIRKYNTNDFWELSQLEAGVPYETALYVPKIVALAFVSRNKEVFGCADVELDPPEPFEATDRETKNKTPTSRVLADARVSTEVSAARPEPSRAEPSRPEPSPSLRPHTLRWGESLEHLAALHGTTESRLRAMNGFTDPTPPRPGTVIQVPNGSAKSTALDPPVAVVPARTAEPGQKRVFYEVVWGDSIDGIANALGVTADQLGQWNNIDKGAKLHGKMVLQAFVPEAANLSLVRTFVPEDARILVAGSDAFFDHFESKNGRVRIVVTAKPGDTMASIGKKHGLSIGMLERINHRSRLGELRAGDKLVVYSKAGVVPEAPKPLERPTAIGTQVGAPVTDDVLDEGPIPGDDG